MSHLLNSIFDNKTLDKVVSFDGAGASVLKPEFISRVYKLKNELVVKEESRIALCFQETLEFSIALFAVLLAKKTPVLLPNNLDGTLANFSKEYDLVLNHIDVQENIDVQETGIDLQLDQEVILFTSGSTGAPKKIIKNLGNILAELESHEIFFSGEKRIDRVYATVSHQHIYGLLFRVLWPLVKGKPFAQFNIEFPEQLKEIEGSGGSYALVSSPAFLKRMNDIEGPFEKCSFLISSGGLLDKAVSAHVEKLFKTTPLEILGSTETGGVAYRRQGNKNPKGVWNAMSSVEIQSGPGGLLEVQSPFFSETKLLMGDKVSLSTRGVFELLGRADRVVKIEEKRVSLPEMEKKISDHPLVSDVALVFQNEGRQQILSVIELSEEGAEFLKKNGKLKLNQSIKSFLKSDFENMTLPRRFRYVSHLPVNPQGKLEYKNILELFNVP